MARESNRREFVKQALMGGAAAGMAAGCGFHAAANDAGAAPAPIDLTTNKEGMERGKIGDLAVSRILLGGNLLTHFTHSRDLKYVYDLCAHYNTDEKIMETMSLAEANGVNTLVIHTVPRAMATLKAHRDERGGKIQWIICPTAQVDKEPDAYAAQVKELKEMGTEAVYLWGVAGDRFASEGNVEAVKRAVGIGHDHGMPSGVGAHDIEVIRLCEKHNIPADFYIKTFHHHNYPTGPKPEEIKGPHSEIPGYWCKDPNEVIEVMKDVEKPWIAFKVMAAGAIPPEDALQYVFNNGADFSLLGMFDFEIEKDATIARQVLANVQRTRPWRAPAV